jgi:hypothetical protein
MIQTNFNKIDTNFWDNHRDITAINPFKDLYKNDSSEDKIDSSNMMWFVVLCYDKTSKFFKLAGEGIDGKHILIGEDFLNDPEYYHTNQDILDTLINKYMDLQMTATERQLYELEETLDARRNLIKKLRQSDDTKIWIELDKVIKNTQIITKEIEAMKAKLMEEDVTGTTKGGAALSLRD